MLLYKFCAFYSAVTVSVSLQVHTWEGGQVVEKEVVVDARVVDGRVVPIKTIKKKVLVGGKPVSTKDSPPISLEDFVCPPIKVKLVVACLP